MMEGRTGFGLFASWAPDTASGQSSKPRNLVLLPFRLSQPFGKALQHHFSLAGRLFFRGIGHVFHQCSTHCVVALVINGLSVAPTDGPFEIEPGAMHRFGRPLDVSLVERAFLDEVVEERTTVTFLRTIARDITGHFAG